MKIMKYIYCVIFIIKIFRNNQGRFTKQDATRASFTKKKKKRTRIYSQKPKKMKNSGRGIQGKCKRPKMIAIQ